MRMFAGVIVSLAVLSANQCFAGDIDEAILAGDRAKVVQLLDAGADLEEQTDMGPPLAVAAFHGNLGIVRLLVERGANLEAAGGFLQARALHRAAAYGHLEVVEYLLSRGVEIDCRTAAQSTPLHEATNQGHLEVVHVLLAKGSNPNARDNRQDTPLHHAIFHERADIAALLLDFEADAKLAGRYGLTPLHWAAEVGLDGIIPRLVLNGAELEALDGANRSPLKAAVEWKQLRAAEILRTLGARE